MAALGSLMAGARSRQAAPPKHATYKEMLAPLPAAPAAAAPVLPLSPTGAHSADPGGGAFVMHAVTPRDTLMGLSLKYGVSVAELRRLNDLPTENISMLRTLKVRPALAGGSGAGDEESRASKLRRFRVSNGIPEEEATFYLDDAGWDVGEAQTAFDRDAREFDPATERGAVSAAIAPGSAISASAGPAARSVTSASAAATVLPVSDEDPADSVAGEGARLLAGESTAVQPRHHGSLRRRVGHGGDQQG